jgi:hypothetical protein
MGFLGAIGAALASGLAGGLLGMASKPKLKFKGVPIQPLIPELAEGAGAYYGLMGDILGQAENILQGYKRIGQAGMKAVAGYSPYFIQTPFGVLPATRLAQRALQMQTFPLYEQLRFLKILEEPLSRAEATLWKQEHLRRQKQYIPVREMSDLGYFTQGFLRGSTPFINPGMIGGIFG